jgi:hypothetical protein
MTISATGESFFSYADQLLLWTASVMVEAAVS